MARAMRGVALAVVLLTGAFGRAAPAADVEAGARLAQGCSTCHGAGGVSVGDGFPHLAAQREAYLAAQLKAYQAGTRRNEVMQGVVARLSAADIADLAAYYASVPGAAPGARGRSEVALAGDRTTFPADYRTRFRRYHVIDFPATKQVRFYWGDPAAVAAAGAGRPFPAGSSLLVEIFAAKLDAAGRPETGADGHFVPDRLTGFTHMEKQDGWSATVPEVLRNGDWRYAAFGPDGSRRGPLNEAPCLACHKPHDDTDFTFTRTFMTGAR
jgi:cytochrome c553